MCYVRVLVLPIFRRHWLFHTHVVSSRPAAASVQADWRKGVGLEEKIRLLLESIKQRLGARIVKTWEDLESAKDGTFQNRIYRLAQGALSREDPQEVSLRSVPHDSEVDRMDVFYPKSIPERLVRRRMRLMVKGSLRKHKVNMMGWSMGFFPLIPLLATPLPNIPLYYAGYRVYCHYNAWVGCSTLEMGLHRLNAISMLKLRTDIEKWKQAGVEFPRDSWVHRVLQEDKRYLDLLEQASAKWVPKTSPWEMRFVKCDILEKHVCPDKRKKSPLDDDAAFEVGHHFESSDVMKNVARARKRAIGGMFPTQMQ